MHIAAGLRLGRIAGIEIAADWSLLIIFWLITFTLAVGVFPGWHPDWGAALSWATALAAALLFFASVLVHELSHALVGRAHGIVIRRITLFMFGGMAQMENEPSTWRAEFAMAIVGPLASLALGITFLGLATRRASQAGQGFAWLLMASGFVMLLGVRVPLLGGGFLNGLWLALIGWFLNNAAVMSYRQLLMRESLAAVPVAGLMQTRLTRIDPQMRVSTLVDEHVMPSGQRSFPVEQDGRFLGMVCLSDLRKRERRAWEHTTVGEIMTPVAALVTVAPRHGSFETLALLAGHDLNQLPVVEDGRLIGLIRREDILKWLSLHGEREPD